jgi:pseudouridine-5'-phosphate glycosidase
MSIQNASPLVVSEEISDTLATGQAVVALESTIISHGLPTATSAATARAFEAAVRAEGAVPATLAVVDGAVRVGLSDDQLVRVAEGEDVVKTSVRDLGPVLATGRTGATTVASTAYLSHLAGIRLFATGGLGGVHRGARETWDESADLTTLAGVPVTVVCAGVKSILDTAATLERMESLSIPVLGYGTDAMPGFYVRDSGLPVPWRADSSQEVVEVMLAREGLRLPQAVVLAQPVRAEDEMDGDLHEETLQAGLAEIDRRQVTGKDVTPFLLGWFHEHTGGASLATNVALATANARLAAQVAVLLAKA